MGEHSSFTVRSERARANFFQTTPSIPLFIPTIKSNQNLLSGCLNHLWFRPNPVTVNSFHMLLQFKVRHSSNAANNYWLCDSKERNCMQYVAGVASTQNHDAYSQSNVRFMTDVQQWNAAASCWSHRLTNLHYCSKIITLLSRIVYFTMKDDVFRSSFLSNSNHCCTWRIKKVTSFWR